MNNKNKVRIIGGNWRGRIINFPANTKIRPTPDRVRETLFNWLQNTISGTNCLDLFAGSGIIGFEAISRGANNVVFLEKDVKCVNGLLNTQKILNCDKSSIINANIPKYILKSNQPFDIVFMDPPFYKNLISPTCRWLEENNLIKQNSLVYIEIESTVKTIPVPAEWRKLKSKNAGIAGYNLYEKV